MSADVSLMLFSSDEEAGFLIPYHALVPGDKKTTSSIFVFDPKTCYREENSDKNVGELWATTLLWPKA